jgi:hypothetical protein
MKLKELYRKLCFHLLWLDMATLKTDSKFKKFIIRKIYKPIGFFFRKQYYKLTYK